MKSSTTKIKRQFFDSLKRGTGETYLIQIENPNIDFSEFIIKGGTTNYAIDQQSEGSRAFYILGLIKKSKQRGKIIKAILLRVTKCLLMFPILKIAMTKMFKH